MSLNYKQMIKEFREQKKICEKKEYTLDYTLLKREYIQKKKNELENKLLKSGPNQSNKNLKNKWDKAEENFWNDIFGSVTTKESLC